jgi:thioredoxin 1
MTHSVHRIRDSEDFNRLMRESYDKLVVIDYCAPWCRPCQKFEPIFEKLACDYSSALFARMNIEEIPKITEGEKISSVPTFVLYRCGCEVNRLEGASESKLRSLID